MEPVIPALFLDALPGNFNSAVIFQRIGMAVRQV
jgi:hypothetical protein